MDIVGTVRAEASAVVIPGAITMAEFLSTVWDGDEADAEARKVQHAADSGWGHIQAARMLREVQAKRAILAEWQRLEEVYAADPSPVNTAALEVMHNVIRLLAEARSGEWAGPAERSA